MSMGLATITKHLVSAVGEILVGTVQGVIQFGEKYLPKSVSKLEDLISVVMRKQKDDTLTLPEIKISMIAPTGFGKTTLLSTLILEIEKNRSANITVEPCEEADKKRLEAFNKNINEVIQVGKETYSITELDYRGTPSSHEFKFKIILENGENKIVQPFSIMDIPGAWIDPNKRDESKWKEFEEHLSKSVILWIPIDSNVLSKPYLEEDKLTSAKLLDTTDIQNLAQLWAKNRNKGDNSSVSFIPVKCESYGSQDSRNDNSGKSILRNSFNQMYSGVQKSIDETENEITKYYIPVETIGCIQLGTYKWNNTNTKFEAKYKICGDYRQPKDADKLLKIIYQAASFHIDEMEKNSRIKIEELKKSKDWNPIKRKKEIRELEKALTNINMELSPIIKEFDKLSKVEIEQLY